jgi:hypothetical protein
MMRQVREHGCTVRVDNGEIRVCPLGAGEDRAYYTDDRQDAVDTAKAMTNGTTTSR